MLEQTRLILEVILCRFQKETIAQMFVDMVEEYDALASATEALEYKVKTMGEVELTEDDLSKLRAQDK